MAFRSSAIASSGTGGTITATPAGVQAHDYLCGIYSKDGSGATVNLPSGWTQRVDLSNVAPDSQDVWVADKNDATGSDAFGFSDSNGAKENALITAAWSGRNNAAPRTAIGTSTINTTNNASPVSATINGVTAVDGDDIAVWGATDQVGDVSRYTYSTIASYTERQDGVNINWTSGINLQTRDAVSAGATGSFATTITDSGAGGGTGYRGVTIAIAAGAGGGGAATIPRMLGPGRGPFPARRFPSFKQGIVAAPGVNLTLDIDSPGSITVAGQSVTMAFGVALSQQGSITVQGQSLTFGVGVAVSAGSVTVAGQSLTTNINTALSAGSVTIQGGAITFSLSVAPTAGSIVIDGQAITLSLGGSLFLAIDTPGSITINGQDITLTNSGDVAAAGDYWIIAARRRLKR